MNLKQKIYSFKIYSFINYLYFSLFKIICFLLQFKIVKFYLIISLFYNYYHNHYVAVYLVNSTLYLIKYILNAHNISYESIEQNIDYIQYIFIQNISQFICNIFKNLLFNDPDFKNFLISLNESKLKDEIMENLVYKITKEIENYKEKENLQDIEFMMQSSVPILKFGLKYITYYLTNGEIYPAITN